MVNRISSRLTWPIKRLFPVIWFGFLAFGMVMSVRSGLSNGGWISAAIIGVMAVVGFFSMKHFAWNLVDEVHDAGEYLVVRRGNEEERIRLADVMNVNVNKQTNPPQIALKLARRSKFGDEVSFHAPTGIRLNPFARVKLADELIARAHEERSRHAGPGRSNGDRG